MKRQIGFGLPLNVPAEEHRARGSCRKWNAPPYLACSCHSLSIQGEGASENKSRLASNCGALVQNATLNTISCYMLAPIRQPRFPEGAKRV